MPKAKSYVMGARRLHTTTSSIETYEEELDGGVAAPRPTCRSYDSRKTDGQYLHLVGSAEDRTRKTPARSPLAGAAPGELLDVPTLASVAWYFCFQMWFKCG
jgi:hypothetical protein